MDSGMQQSGQKVYRKLPALMISSLWFCHQWAMWYSVLVLLGWCAGNRRTDITMRLRVSLSLSLSAVTRGQITCVSSCEDSVEIGVFSSIRECCDDESAGGFLRGEGICSSCTPFRGAPAIIGQFLAILISPRQLWTLRSVSRLTLRSLWRESHSPPPALPLSTQTSLAVSSCSGGTREER